MPEKKDAFGFRFWLSWILQFAGSFVAAAVIWTVVFTRLFGGISEPEIVIGWALSVFGSWFLLLTPFMRKKERIWKRLNVDDEKAVDAWLAGMGVFLGFLTAGLVVWSLVYRGAIFETQGRVHGGWLRAVVVSWLVISLPFLILLYRRADEIFKSAVLRQAGAAPPFRTVFVEKEKRVLPQEVADRIASLPAVMSKGHLVNVRLKDGRRISDIFVMNGREILGVYDRGSFDFDARDVEEAEPVENFPAYEETKWLRLDGRV